MAHDPELGFPLTPAGAQASTASELDKRVRRLENAAERIQVMSGAPSAPAQDPTGLREGTPVIDRTNRRLYFVVGDGVDPANNVWRYVALT